jgi:diguanylate cyclase (GGDEF)-like protein
MARSDEGEMPATRGRRWRGSLAEWSSWSAGLDGTLLTDAAWNRRHLVVAALTTVNAVGAVVLGVTAPHGSGLWVEVVALVAALTVAWIPKLGRRPRELAIVGALLLCAALQNRYGANFSSLSAVYILGIAVYQDWLPLAAALVGILILPLLAIFTPETLEEWRSFQEESPTTGAFVRTLGVYLAAGVAVLVWRANGVAARDGLTGLATRGLAERRLSQALRNGRHPAVLVCDVDAFRLVADDVPRASADALIRDVGRRLRDVAWESDRLLAAGGGARYILLALQDDDAEDAEQLARRCCELVGSRPFAVDGAEIPLTASVGVAAGQPGDEATDLLRAAEVAMRRAKWRGDPAVAVADEELLGRRPRADGPITAELRRALARDELVLHYQPLVSMASGEILGAEALVRWEHPTRGLLAPDTFLPATELHPWLNAELNRRVARDVMRQVARWDSELPGRLPLGVSMNLTPTRLNEPSIRSNLLAGLDAAGVDASRITIEITESALMDLDIDAPEVLRGIAALGIRIALDDFGTGHSSLARLRDFPLHEIKIDRSFVPGVLEAGTDRALVAAVLAIANEFGALVVVEGVETDDQRQALLGMRQDVLAQGFYFAASMPAEAFTALLEAKAALPR